MIHAKHTVAAYRRAVARLDQLLGPLPLLGMRLWVGLAFWHAGVVKFDDPTGTRFLFESIYHVPLLAPDVAATLGTWIELVLPWLLALGVATRPVAAFLFVYNIVAVVSYPALWPHGFWAGLGNAGDFADHKIWGLMLLTLVAFGPGVLSLDELIARVTRTRKTPPGPATSATGKDGSEPVPVRAPRPGAEA